MQVDGVFDSAKYPNAAKNWGNTIKLREGVLAFLSDHNIFSPNPFQLRAYNAEIDSFKGYKNENSFSVFQVDLKADFSIADIKQLKKFQNKKLNNLLLNSMKKNLKFGGKRGGPLTNPIRVILFCYYYEQNGSGQSFLSFIDV